MNDDDDFSSSSSSSSLFLPNLLLAPTYYRRSSATSVKTRLRKKKRLCHNKLYCLFNIVIIGCIDNKKVQAKAMSEVKSPIPTLKQSPFKNDVLKNKVVIITGGATGIGYACAAAFGTHGCKVAIMSRRKKVIMDGVSKLQALGIDAFGTTVDVRDAARCVEAVNECVQHFGRLDFLINNAAGNFMVSSENLSPGGFATVLGIDLQGCFHMSKAALPHMKITGPNTGAVIINITATLQDYATPFQSHAAAAKAGIDVLTNTLGVEWAEYAH